MEISINDKIFKKFNIRSLTSFIINSKIAIDNKTCRFLFDVLVILKGGIRNGTAIDIKTYKKTIQE